MSDNKENFWVNPGGPGVSAGPMDLAPSVAPPPPEVRVRTLKSDLESMAESGGGQPQFKSVKAPKVSAEEKPKEPGKPLTVDTITFVVIVIAVILLAAIIFFSYQLFFANKAPGLAPVNPNPETNSGALAPAAGTDSSQPGLGQQNLGTKTLETGFVHKTYFKKPVDQFLTLAVQVTATNAQDLQTFGQKLSVALQTVNQVGPTNQSSTLIEINIKGVDGHDLDAQKTFEAADVAVINPQFFAEYFLSDATVFVYSVKGGSASGGKNSVSFWPGFILALKSGENWLFVKSDVGKLETSPKLVNFFLSPPGNAETKGFRDTLEDGQPARILNFTSASATSSFVYGWFHDKLILSTSEEGLKEAVLRL